jgi:regulator of chromosome condensation
VDIKNNNSDSESNSRLNPRESTSVEVDISEILEGTVFMELAARDSVIFALTNKGLVFG